MTLLPPNPSVPSCPLPILSPPSNLPIQPTILLMPQQEGLACIISNSLGLTASQTSSAAVSLQLCLSLIKLCSATRVSSSSTYPIHHPYTTSNHYLTCHHLSCQCGVSRSATLVIALVMRAAAQCSPSVPPEIWALKGMQGAYTYVKQKSKWVGPNMSYVPLLFSFSHRLFPHVHRAV